MADEVQETNTTGSEARRVWKRTWADHRWPVRLVSAWVLLILLIQIAAPSTVIERMPLECPADSQNCVRLAHDGSSFRNQGLTAPSFAATPEEVRNAVSGWLVNHQGGSDLLEIANQNPQGSLLHGEDRTKLLFYPDDLYVLASCEANGLTDLTLQSQSRLGVGDLGANHDRLVALLKYLSSYVWSQNSCDFVSNNPA